MKQEIPRELINRIKNVTAKRARTVLEHILGHGYVTTEELKQKYGYDHPPRAARDVREQGIPLETFKVKSSSGRSIAAYRFDLSGALEHGKEGRQQFPKQLKENLLAKTGPSCGICGGRFDIKHLQVDHRVPYEVAGESEGEDTESFMLLCASCNRTKSWACEHCRNWVELKKPALCKSCYWANPTTYDHVALVQVRRVDITWVGKEAESFDQLRETSRKSGLAIQDLIKKFIARSLE